MVHDDSAESARARLVSKIIEENYSTAANLEPGSADSELPAKVKHKELIRAAGRAAVEDSLQSVLGGTKRKASEMTAEGIAAQWFAYAEVYGTNGMASGGVRSAPAGPSLSEGDAQAPSSSTSASVATEVMAPAWDVQP